MGAQHHYSINVRLVVVDFEIDVSRCDSTSTQTQMSLRRFTKPIDETIPVPALLYTDEELLASQDNVGIYDGYVLSPSPSTHA
jgi:hypothetical protein